MKNPSHFFLRFTLYALRFMCSLYLDSDGDEGPDLRCHPTGHFHSLARLAVIEETLKLGRIFAGLEKQLVALDHFPGDIWGSGGDLDNQMCGVMAELVEITRHLFESQRFEGTVATLDFPGEFDQYGPPHGLSSAYSAGIQSKITEITNSARDPKIVALRPTTAGTEENPPAGQQ